MPKVALFTPFPPRFGAGSVILHSLIEKLSDCQVSWYFCADEKEPQLTGQRQIGRSLSGGPLWQDMLRGLRLWYLPRPKEIVALADSLTSFKPDIFWLVAHY